VPCGLRRVGWCDGSPARDSARPESAAARVARRPAGPASRYGYIGLCYGPPGVGETLSARSYSRWDEVKQADRWGTGPTENLALDTVFYTPSVVNAPGNVSADIRRSRDTLRDLARRPLRLEKEERLKGIQRRDEEHHAKLLYEHDWLAEPFPECHPKYGEVAKEYSVKEMQIRDPTTLILIDEADRLRMASLEQVRAIFDAGAIGVILIGMPGLEKRLARYPQFYSRIGFVHEFRPLGFRDSPTAGAARGASRCAPPPAAVGPRDSSGHHPDHGR
jgi:hypothetical protein